MASEKLLEKKLREGVEKLGGLAIKFFCPTFTGLPDRIILMPGGRVYFAEMKTTGEKLRPRQEVVHRQLRNLGFTVWTIDDYPLLTFVLNKIQSDQL